MSKPKDATEAREPGVHPGRRRFLAQGAGLLALGVLATVPGAAEASTGALRRRFHILRLAEARPRPAPGVTVRRDGGDLLVSIPGADPGLALNETAAEVFLACDGTRTVAAVASVLCRRYRVDPGRARADAARVVDALVRARCLVL